MSKLVSAGIRTFISLQEADERNSRTGVVFPDYEPVLKQLERGVGAPLTFHRFPICDCTAPAPGLAARALDLIDESLSEGRPVYLHCWGGHGRTATIVGCWLVRHGTPGPDALTRITQLRSKYAELVDEPAPQTKSQIELVRHWTEIDPSTGSTSQKEARGSGRMRSEDSVVDEYVRANGLTPVNDSDPNDFRFNIGERFKAARDSGTRIIRGFCRDRDGVALYVVERPTKTLTTKRAWKAHVEYIRDGERVPESTAPAAPKPSTPSKPKNSSLTISVEPLSLHDRYLGAMFGLAIGDAVGTTLEFKAPGTFSSITDMVGGGPFGLKPGEWTDDTSMALCLAESLIHAAGSDPLDQMRRYVAWWKQGHLSSTGKCFDIGVTTSAALSRFLQNGDPMAGSRDSHSAGNGSLMRLAPIPLAYRANIDLAIKVAAESSRTTHAAAEAVDACRFMTALMIRALGGASKEELLHPNLWEKSLRDPTEPLAPKVLAVARGSYKTKNPPILRGTGYVVDCLEAALWAFYHHDSYAQAVLAAANLGDDADTTAAVCGQLAGALYGLNGILEKWVEKVACRETIAQLARGLLVLSKYLAQAGI